MRLSASRIRSINRAIARVQSSAWSVPVRNPHRTLANPNTGRLRERGRVREGRCGSKERHAVTPATGIGEQMHRLSVLCSPLSGVRKILHAAPPGASC
jgi:hypothetical protein